MGFSSLPNAGSYVLGVCGCVCLCVFDDGARVCFVWRRDRTQITLRYLTPRHRLKLSQKLHQVLRLFGWLLGYVVDYVALIFLFISNGIRNPYFNS